MTDSDVENLDCEFICNNLKNEFIAMSGQKVLISGGAGFLGFYLIKSMLHWNKSNLKSNPIEVFLYDSFIRGEPRWIKNLKGDKNLLIKKHDITEELKDEKKDFNFIIHAASIASPTFYRKYPIETMDANVEGLRNLLNYSLNQKKNGKEIKGFLFFSTSEIYGDPDSKNIPTNEEYRGNVSCTGPRACYDESKRYGETLCVNFSKKYDLPIKIARPFNNYGPGLKISDGRVLPDFVSNILNDENIKILSDGTPTRTFCYVADAVVGYLKILIRGKSGESYNIGNEEPEISVLDLAKKLTKISSELFQIKVDVINEKSKDKYYLVDNPNRRCPDIRKASQHLEFKPKISLEEGLKRSLIWYKNNND